MYLQRATMNRDTFNMLNDEAVSGKKMVECCQRKVAEMFVVNGIELTIVDHVFDIRRFDDGDPVVLQQMMDASDNTI